jgi:hypothetical protein
MRRTREQWAADVAAFEGAKVPLERFCAVRGIAPSTLRWWRWRLRREEGIRLLPVEVVGDVAAERGAEPLVVAFSDVELRVHVGADVDYVAALVARLRRP